MGLWFNMARYRIDETPGPELLGSEFKGGENWLIVQKPNGLTYRMLASSLPLLGSSNNIEWLDIPYSGSNSSGDVNIHIGGIFSKPNISMVLVAYAARMGANPNATFTFYTSRERIEDFKHSLYVNKSDKAQWSAHYIWVPIVDNELILNISDNHNTGTRYIDILAAM